MVIDDAQSANFVSVHVPGQACDHATWVNSESAHAVLLAYSVEGDRKQGIGRL